MTEPTPTLPPRKGDRCTGSMKLKLRRSPSPDPSPDEQTRTIVVRIEIMRTGPSAVKALVWIPPDGDEPERSGGSVGIRMKGPCLADPSQRLWTVVALDGQHDGHIYVGEMEVVFALLDVALRQASGNTIRCAG